MKITENDLGNGIKSYLCSNSAGFTVDILNFAGIIRSIKLPKGGDVVLGYDDPQQYPSTPGYFGALIGPYANRISNASFQLSGKTYELEANNGKNNLHSGSTGLHTKIFQAKITPDALILSTTLPHLEGGFPGNLEVEVHYKVSEENALTLAYFAKTDEDTIVNLTNHVYFNLDGGGNPCLDNYLQMTAQEFTVNNQEALPTGEIRSVSGTAMDFRQGKNLGVDIDSPDENIQIASGFNHNYIINREKTKKEFATAEGKLAKMRVSSNSPCVQLYSGQFIVAHTGKNNTKYGKHSGFCLETGVYPNAINQENFPSPVVKAGETWSYETTFTFEEK